LKRARSAYDESVALYRQQVLVAFGDVENSLSAIRHLTDQAEAQSRALTSSRRAASLAEDRYRSGIVAYIEVVDANRDALTAERASAQLAGERLIATVQLIKALGGGWNEKEVVASVAPLKAPPAADAAN
jgi:multidrug efflux system outer membrane protein